MNPLVPGKGALPPRVLRSDSFVFGQVRQRAGVTPEVKGDPGLLPPRTVAPREAQVIRAVVGGQAVRAGGRDWLQVRGVDSLRRVDELAVRTRDRQAPAAPPILLHVS